jgi:hypothetical protein
LRPLRPGVLAQVVEDSLQVAGSAMAGAGGRGKVLDASAGGEALGGSSKR